MEIMWQKHHSEQKKAERKLTISNEKSKKKMIQDLLNEAKSITSNHRSNHNGHPQIQADPFATNKLTSGGFSKEPVQIKSCKYQARHFNVQNVDNIFDVGDHEMEGTIEGEDDCGDEMKGKRQTIHSFNDALQNKSWN